MLTEIQIHILFLVDKKAGANKQLYLPFKDIYNDMPEEYSGEDVLKALNVLTNLGYLESRDRSYRLTISGLIFIESYIISNDIYKIIRQELKYELKKELKEEIEEEVKSRIGYQWFFIITTAAVILAVIFLK